MHCESAIVPVSVHSDSANGNILLLTNIVYVINKKKCHFNSFVLCYQFQIRHASEQALLNVQTAKGGVTNVPTHGFSLNFTHK